MEREKEHPPGRTLPLNLPLLNIVNAQLKQHRRKVLLLFPSTPDALETFSALVAAVALGATPSGAHETGLDGILLVAEKLLMDGMRNQRERLARQAEVLAKELGKVLGSERGGEIPFDAIPEVEGGDLYVKLERESGVGF